VRERDRRTYTVVWVAVTAVATAILVVAGSPGFAAAFAAVLGIGLVAFLRTTHPRGRAKPHLGIFFDDTEAAPADPSAATASPAAASGGPDDAEVIDLRQPARRAGADNSLATRETASAGEGTRPAGEMSDELADHHVRLLRQVQVKLQDYE
jgi:hypothetical protein